MDNFVFLLVLESKYYMAYTWKNPLMGWKGWLTLLGVIDTFGGGWKLLKPLGLGWVGMIDKLLLSLPLSEWSDFCPIYFVSGTQIGK